VGCDAATLNAARIKGSHAAIKTGHARGRGGLRGVDAGRQQDELTAYPSASSKSWLREELQKARNFKQWFKKGLTSAADDRHRAVAAAQAGLKRAVDDHAPKPDTRT
jgi:electron-transferring-flavoprotein dehydrogenase